MATQKWTDDAERWTDPETGEMDPSERVPYIAKQWRMNDGEAREAVRRDHEGKR